ncbi:putative 28S ribosomal protein S10, mitochondrial [Oryzias melastigma]|uniref:Small ribosomal subunit protein uS10m n=1 Tax=Oryzias melastigma TaxID=30732 RepID=A0A3B3BW44_ORYME|nr:probable 28S ribosomal protein S10, mitochondrial [Oryzias melastigma]KAF6728353.1 putative 28S ribosomal protein S10, mitochondrial [Oryzias melastigma]
MAALMAVRRQFLACFRLTRDISQVRCLGTSFVQGKCSINRSLLSQTHFHTSALVSTPSAITVTEEPDTLFQKVVILVKGHDKAVLDSYEFFASLAAKELGINVSKVSEPRKDIERMTLLKSVHIFKKHRVQYEMRTHYRRIELSHITGCTAQVYLEYIQRNLPEGVAMEVTKTSMEKVPDHILEPMWKPKPADEPNQ